MIKIGKKAPVFEAPAVINGKDIIENFSSQKYIGKQNVLLFFYPKDFTFVCPTELLMLQKNEKAFAQRDVAVVACSTDTEETHWAWLQTPKEKGGILGVTFPIVADTSKVITSNFNVLGGEWYFSEDGEMAFEGEPIAYRGSFLIDKEGFVRHMSINDLPLGRNIDELLRTVDMLAHVEKNGEVCPVNWQRGEIGLKPTPAGVVDYWKELQKRY